MRPTTMSSCPEVVHKRVSRTAAGSASWGQGLSLVASFCPVWSARARTLVAVASEGGLTAADAAARFGFERATTTEEMLADDEIDGVVITTRHSSHAALTVAALRAGKAVFVEKPLALTETELSEVVQALPHGRFLMVGFNRRFAPFVTDAIDMLQTSVHRSMAIRVNAGRLPDDHWLHDPRVGGGRLLGEGCHFIDLLMHCMGTRLEAVHAFATPLARRSLECSDEFAVSLRFADGALGTLLYTAEGDARMGKERIEAFAAGQSLVIDDFRRLERYRDGRRSHVKRRQDKGHRQELERFLAACRGEDEPPDPCILLRIDPGDVRRRRITAEWPTRS